VEHALGLNSRTIDPVEIRDVPEAVQKFPVEPFLAAIGQIAVRAEMALDRTL
jgi:hypothetical protein